ncbi:MAG: hypothetical protein IJZ85_02040 [Lachnospiraceae bacterium]|nr:hypothetical protein [Lachnospiraceae bacterium]
MLETKYRRFYLCSLLIIIAASIYPIYMGGKIILLYLENGVIPVEDYPKYIIPYTPMCIALIFVTAVYPLLYRWLCGKALLAASVLGTIIFLIGEWSFERIPVLEGYKSVPLESWQLSLCMATPEVLQSIGQPIYAEQNPAFKVHFYLIVIVIILTVTGVLHGYTHMIRENDTAKKRPLLVQTVCVVLFIGFCILACFTAFFRNGTIYISPLSSVLTGMFFVLFGVTFGVYGATLMYAPESAQESEKVSGGNVSVEEVNGDKGAEAIWSGRGHAAGKGKWRVWLPAGIAMLTTIAMYIGELVLMGGELFRFGKGFFFERVGVVPFSLCDIAIILVAGGVTWGIAKWLRK